MLQDFLTDLTSITVSDIDLCDICLLGYFSEISGGI